MHKRLKQPMNRNKIKTISDSKQLSSVRLYRIVFVGYFARFFACIILVSVVLQPLARAEASEEVVTNGVASAAIADVPIDIPAVADGVDVVTQAGDVPPIAALSPLSENSVDPIINSSLTTVAAPIPGDSNVQNTGTDSSDTSVVASSSGEQSGVDGSILTSEDVGHMTDNTVVLEDDVILIPATTSSSTPDLTIPVSTVQSDSQIQFNKADCVAVADGSFYCQPKKPVPPLSQNGFFALPDSDGDLEIYMQKDGQMNQLTHNTVDDAAPFYDSLSQTIVWHRLIDDRYQIMSYIIESGEETQLTSGTVNNMEPNRAGAYTVWQHWNADNWDIELSDGKTTKILTSSLEHDIAPSIRGTLVVWNKLGFDKSQTIELYDISSGEFTTITDTDGGVISNPRMVLVYESSFENGDVVTKGYDMLTGEIAELASTPVQMPDEIPPPDSTGETRALIQAKSGQKEESEIIDGSQLKTADPDPNLVPQSSVISNASTSLTLLVATSSPSLTLDLRLESTEPVVHTTDIMIEAFTTTTTVAD